jgi:hypothetical protein
MEEAEACIKIQNDLTGHFEFNKRLKKGGG